MTIFAEAEEKSNGSSETLLCFKEKMRMEEEGAAGYKNISHLISCE